MGFTVSSLCASKFTKLYTTIVSFITFNRQVFVNLKCNTSATEPTITTKGDSESYKIYVSNVHYYDNSTVHYIQLIQ